MDQLLEYHCSRTIDTNSTHHSLQSSLFAMLHMVLIIFILVSVFLLIGGCEGKSKKEKDKKSRKEKKDKTKKDKSKEDRSQKAEEHSHKSSARDPDGFPPQPQHVSPSSNRSPPRIAEQNPNDVSNDPFDPAPGPLPILNPPAPTLTPQHEIPLPHPNDPEPETPRIHIEKEKTPPTQKIDISPSKKSDKEPVSNQQFSIANQASFQLLTEKAPASMMGGASERPVMIKMRTSDDLSIAPQISLGLMDEHAPYAVPHKDVALKTAPAQYGAAVPPRNSPTTTIPAGPIRSRLTSAPVPTPMPTPIPILQKGSVMKIKDSDVRDCRPKIKPPPKKKSVTPNSLKTVGSEGGVTTARAKKDSFPSFKTINKTAENDDDERSLSPIDSAKGKTVEGKEVSTVNTVPRSEIPATEIQEVKQKGQLKKGKPVIVDKDKPNRNQKRIEEHARLAAEVTELAHRQAKKQKLGPIVTSQRTSSVKHVTSLKNESEQQTSKQQPTTTNNNTETKGTTKIEEQSGAKSSIKDATGTAEDSKKQEQRYVSPKEPMYQTLYGLDSFR